MVGRDDQAAPWTTASHLYSTELARTQLSQQVLRPGHARQVTGRTRKYMKMLYKISLTSRSRPEVAIPRIPGDGKNVLKVVV